jgi:mannose-6-phosphate isomerase-like protein (cupin superfamily)
VAYHSYGYTTDVRCGGPPARLRTGGGAADSPSLIALAERRSKRSRRSLPRHIAMAPTAAARHTEPMGTDYDIHLDVKYEHGTLIDVAAEAAAHEPWFNQTLTQVDEAVVRLGVIEGDFHWHKHDDQDEFFLVLEGQLLIDLADRDTVVLDPHQGFTVPRGVEHRTRAPQRTVILMVEPAGVQPTGT